MIQYSLHCENEHKFDAWFRNAAAFDEQSERGIVTCPICSSGTVSKALMAPALSGITKSQDNSENDKSENKISLSSGHPQQAELRAAMQALRDKVTAEADYVGDKFAQEARKIHDQESDARGIYGEATTDEVASLVEDGIDFMPLPTAPEDHN